MKGQYGGPMSIEDLFQALWQDREFFAHHNITHVRATALYFTPCDALGSAVVIRKHNKPVDGYVSAGGYRSAASTYDGDRLTPETVLRPAAEH